jgi:two-component system, NarL family, sensor kinase
LGLPRDAGTARDAIRSSHRHFSVGCRRRQPRAASPGFGAIWDRGQHALRPSVAFGVVLLGCSIASSGRRLWLAVLPVLLGALGLLALLQVPLAWSLATRVSRAERERRRSLERGLDAQQQERRRVAADLHDGVVQTLAGVSYRIGAVEHHLDASTPAPVRGAISASARDTRDAIRQLRSLLVDIYPPSLEREGLVPALRDLMSRANGPQVEAHLVVPNESLSLDAGQQPLLFRSAQEALRNALAHASARHISIGLEQLDGIARLTVRDDGVGFDTASALARSATGHFGLRALDDLVHEQGGVMKVKSTAGTGTIVVVEVPT